MIELIKDQSISTNNQPLNLNNFIVRSEFIGLHQATSLDPQLLHKLDKIKHTAPLHAQKVSGKQCRLMKYPTNSEPWN